MTDISRRHWQERRCLKEIEDWLVVFSVSGAE
jgi:hypothetical protein